MTQRYEQSSLKHVVNRKLNKSVALGIIIFIRRDIGQIIEPWMQKVKSTANKIPGDRRCIGLTPAMPIGNWTVKFVESDGEAEDQNENQ